MKITLTIFSFLFFVAVGSAQDYKEMMESADYSVQQVVDAAEAYFADKDKGRGSGYKQFKRWEYNATRLMQEDGYVRPFSETMDELERHNAYLNETAQERAILQDNWTEIGPTSWNATTSWNPGVGRITGIAVDPANIQHIIVGANTGGVWRTTDEGANWTPLNDFFSNLSVFSVAIDPQDENTYYFGSSSGLVFKSTDAGATWNEIGDVSSSLINKILIHPTNSDIIFASSQNAGLYRTTNGGNTWESVITDGRSYDVEFKPNDLNTVYASGTRFHKSTDGGATFEIVNGGFSTGAKMIGVSEDDPTIVYVLQASGSIFGGFFSSNDSGDTFTQLDHSGKNYFGYSTTAQDNSGQAPRDMDIAVNPTDASEVHIAGVLTWRSTDGGTNFSITSDWIPGSAAGAGIGYCHADVDFLAFTGTTLYVGSDGGIFKADDTDAISANYYTDLTSGLGIRQFYKIGISQTEDLVITGGAQDNGSSFYNETDGWRDWLGADGMEGFIAPDRNNIMYGTSQNGSLYRTLNGGLGYTGLQEPGPGSGEWVTPFEADPTAINTIYVGYDAVYKSINRGAAWTRIMQTIGSGRLDHLKIAQSDNLIMYTANGNTLYKTVDGGATDWEVVSFPGGNINDIAIHPTDPNRVALASTTGNKVYVTVDGGENWGNYRKNLPNFTSLDLVWEDNGRNGLYLGMNYGIFYIDDTFTDWQPYSNLLPNVIINELEINTVTQTIYAATYGRGVWASPTVDRLLSSDDFIAEDSVIVYPNPATNEITLKLLQPVTGEVRIFDITGKLVLFQAKSELASQHLIDISRLNTGAYFLRLNTEEGTITKKILKN